MIAGLQKEVKIETFLIWFGLPISLPFDFYLSLWIRKPALRFPRYLGKRALSATACWRRNASSMNVGLSWKGRCSACPLVANFFSRAGRFGDPIPHVTVVPILHPFNTCILFHFNSKACPCLQQVCDPLIHWVTLSYRGSPYLLKPYQTSDPSLADWRKP